MIELRPPDEEESGDQQNGKDQPCHVSLIWCMAHGDGDGCAVVVGQEGLDVSHASILIPDGTGPHGAGCGRDRFGRAASRDGGAFTSYPADGMAVTGYPFRSFHHVAALVTKTFGFFDHRHVRDICHVRGMVRVH